MATATIISGHSYRHHRHHQPPKFLHLEALVADQKSNSTVDNDDDSDSFEMIKFYDHHHSINPENHIPKSVVMDLKKPPLKPNWSQQRSLPITGKSFPVNVTDWSKILKDPYNLRLEYGGGSGDDEVVDDDWLPPHEYLGRIRTASLSVHEGVGRTLKGRDLSSLRNAIWKQTGFEQD